MENKSKRVMKLCESCYEKEFSKSVFSFKDIYVPGFADEEEKCACCGSDMINTHLSPSDFRTLTVLSDDNKFFMDAMSKLAQESPEEFKNKMETFEQQLRQRDPVRTGRRGNRDRVRLFIKKCSNKDESINHRTGYCDIIEIHEDKHYDSCPICGGILTDTCLTSTDFIEIDNAYDGNRRFLESMIKLADRDIIEFELEMGEVRHRSDIIAANRRAERAARRASLPKCPTCQSTDIQKMSGFERGVSIFGLGLFSKKINKTYKCNQCGYMW